MRIVVCVKQVLDPKSVKISRSREEFDLREARKILNPADKYALEAALRLREALGGEVIALTIGDADAEDVAREAVAFGADRAVLIAAAGPLSGQAVTALAAAGVARLGSIDLALTGQIGATDGTGSLAPRLAAALGWPIVLDASQINAEAAGLAAIVPDDAAAIQVSVALPAVISVAPGPTRPRYPHPARIAVAWNAELLETWDAAELGLTDDALAPDTELGGLILGPERTRGQMISGTPAEAAHELLSALRSRRIVE